MARENRCGWANGQTAWRQPLPCPFWIVRRLQILPIQSAGGLCGSDHSASPIRSQPPTHWSSENLSGLTKHEFSADTTTTGATLACPATRLVTLRPEN